MKTKDEFFKQLKETPEEDRNILWSIGYSWEYLYDLWKEDMDMSVAFLVDALVAKEEMDSGKVETYIPRSTKYPKNGL